MYDHHQLFTRLYLHLSRQSVRPSVRPFEQVCASAPTPRKRLWLHQWATRLQGDRLTLPTSCVRWLGGADDVPFEVGQYKSLILILGTCPVTLVSPCIIGKPMIVVVVVFDTFRAPPQSRRRSSHVFNFLFERRYLPRLASNSRTDGIWMVL